MPDDAAVIREVNAAFAKCPRPDHFTDHTHCDECAEHDELLRSRDNDTLQLADVGNPGWDPLCYVDAAGFGYLFPGLTRLALTDPGPEHDWYGPQLLSHLTYAPQGEGNRHLRAFDAEQRRAVVNLLRHLAETRSMLTDKYGCSDDLLYAIELWSKAGEADDMKK
jgi:hypothetical protein